MCRAVGTRHFIFLILYRNAWKAWHPSFSRRGRQLSLMRRTGMWQLQIGLCVKRLIEVNAKCRHLYSPLLLLSPSLWFNSPPPPCVNNYKCTVYSMWGWGALGVLLETIYSARVFTLSIWPDSEPTKLLDLPPTTPNKNLGGEGASDRKTHATKSLFRPIF